MAAVMMIKNVLYQVTGLISTAANVSDCVKVSLSKKLKPCGSQTFYFFLMFPRLLRPSARDLKINLWLPPLRLSQSVKHAERCREVRRLQGNTSASHVEDFPFFQPLKSPPT